MIKTLLLSCLCFMICGGPHFTNRDELGKYVKKTYKTDLLCFAYNCQNSALNHDNVGLPKQIVDSGILTTDKSYKYIIVCSDKRFWTIELHEKP